MFKSLVLIKKSLFSILSVLLLLVFWACTPPEPDIEGVIEGKVIKVSDGDTVVVLTEAKEEEKIRLEGIDCPERSQSFGTKARSFTNTLCYGKQVVVQVVGTDRYGRKLGIVWSNKVNVNEELVKNGLAWHYKQYSSSDAYAYWEEEAQEKKLNIWSDPSPLPPWEFRENKRATGN